MAEKKYTFLVHPEANKSQIKEAVEKMFEGTKVKSVNTMNMDGKKKRRGMTVGTTAKTKKAIVALLKYWTLWQRLLRLSVMIPTLQQL